MLIKKLVSEDIVHYKKPSMVIAFPTCDWKCCVEGGFSPSTCQNQPLAQMDSISVSYSEIYDAYVHNPLTSAIVCAGLEPFDHKVDLHNLLLMFRKNRVDDDFVIYTGYTEEEVADEMRAIRNYPYMQLENVIIKFGRYIPGHEKHFDDVLGVYLASDNQYAKRIT